MSKQSNAKEDKNPLVYLKHHNYYRDTKLRRILGDVKTFAMVGASTVWRRPSFYAMKYLQHKGFRIIPINPGRAGGEKLGEKIYGSLADAPYHIDIVDISSPTDTHREIALAAAEAGKHILCEKPMALSADEALEMCRAVKQAGGTHAIGHNYRRVPAIRLAKQMIEEGQLGEIYHWRGTY